MQIIWSNVALIGLERARGYIAQDSPDAAQRVYEQILAAAAHLAEFPSMGRPGRVDNTREIVVSATPYILAYTIDRGRVAIVAVLHTARRWPDQL